MSNITKTSIGLAVGAAFVGSLAFAPQASASAFDLQDLSQGYQQVDDHAEHKDKEGKCGEGKCGEEKKSGGHGGKDAEGKCGEGKCGEGMEKEGKDAEGKCGEGKCGGQS